MRPIIIGLLVLAVIAGGVFWVSQQRLSFGVLEGKQSEATRGDLIVPVTASGVIEPASITQIKGEASGVVVETPFDVGTMVKHGDLIIRLDEDDEQRNVDRAETDYQRSVHAWERARIALEQVQTVGLDLAAAKVQQAEARKMRTQSEYDKKLPNIKSRDGLPPLVTKEEWDQVLSAKMEADAMYDAAIAEQKQAQIAIRMSEWEEKSAEQTKESAKKALEEAQERLRETSVLAPSDGMVLKRNVQIGEVVMSGKTSFTGGTVLMELANVDRIYAVVNVDEADIGQVRELAPPSARPGPTATQPVEIPPEKLDRDQVVEVTVESFPDEKFTGAIERISPQSEVVRAIATFKVWIRITSENREKLIGLLNTQCEARFTVNSVQNAVLVSYDAVKPNPNGTGFGVYVVTKPPPGSDKEGHEFKVCKFGADNGIDVEVIEGLDAGQKVWIELPKKTEKEKEREEAGK